MDVCARQGQHLLGLVSPLAPKHSSDCFSGGRDLHSAQQLWPQVPAPYRERLLFTDAYPVYERLFAAKPMQHHVGKKSAGFTTVVEEANNALCQCVSYLGRKSAAFAHSHFWLTRRLHWFLQHWNLGQAKKFF